MKKKYFFFDIDGTLTTPLQAIFPESTMEALCQLRKQGHFVSLATGRIQADAWEVAKKLSLAAAVSDGGNAVTIDGTILYHTSLPMERVEAFINENSYEDHPWAIVPYNRRYRIARSWLYLSRVKDRYYETGFDRTAAAKNYNAVYKIFVAATKQDVPHMHMCGLPYVWFTSDTMLIEPVHKEKGIMEIMKRYGLRDEDIVVFGDGMNDRAMFRKEWMSIAMGNAKQELKEKATYITTAANDDGIWNACRHFGWI